MNLLWFKTMFNLKKTIMKKLLICMLILSAGAIIKPCLANCQPPEHDYDYLNSLPKHLELKEKTPQKYLMTAEYFNKDIYGDLMSKTKVRGDYTRGLDSGYACWNNAFISHANNPSDPYQPEVKQDYMENIKYIPSSQLMEESFFNSFPDKPDNVLARNLIWDMMMIEGFAWNYFDSLDLNKTYEIPEIHGAFNMANIGLYNHSKIELSWIGISLMNSQLCAVIEYRALDNKIELNLEQMKSKGSELYWGKTWISLATKQIEFAEIYSNTIQEIEMQGMPQKMLFSTKRIVTVDRIK